MGKKPRLQHLEKVFPRLVLADYEETSKKNTLYNCIAYAAGDQTKKWDCPDIPVPGYYWPDKAIRGSEIDALISAFQVIGYKICSNGEIETNCEKVALYADKKGAWLHAAKQLKNGHWSSKIGNLEDIRHASVNDVSGLEYGEVICYMKRELPQS
jgi:hypothetical protein